MNIALSTGTVDRPIKENKINILEELVRLQVLFFTQNERRNNMDNNTNLKFIEVPLLVLKDNDLSSTSKLLMGLITTLTMQNGYCFASNKYLSNIMNVTQRTISSSITSLGRKKYIKVDNYPNARKIYLADFF